MSRLVLVRHGESEWNLERRIQGQSGGGLSDRGEAQSAATARVLAAAYPDAFLAASDLQRCRDSAVPLATALDRSPRIEAGLRERHFGRWTGLLVSEVGERDPERWQRWRAGEDVIGQVGGEDTPTLVDRVLATYRRLLDRAGGRPMICVTHGGPIWHGTVALLGLDHRILGGVANGSVTELDMDGEAARLVSWNQVAHLPPDLRMLERAPGGSAAHGAPTPVAGDTPPKT